MTGQYTDTGRYTMGMDRRARYAPEILNEDEDIGTMPETLGVLRDAVVGHRIVSVERAWTEPEPHLGDIHHIITLDNGKRVQIFDTYDCCAFTELRAFLLHPELVDHVITGVGTTDGYTTWHVYADAGDVLALTVGWSAGDVGYYGYGFMILVEDDDAGDGQGG